ncbi:sigma factor-like helix-turn-helix DNA-binding protein [Alcaligenes faecalis]|uniref:sigma factor-like helix-turn-helix DNA-binding protein n=1 Tax=Alcaligenes faecalis TaxID=511 RepID=UPI0005A85C86|nr:sigma factor-like helix-turn-helix DNA-binding protein [Alcaligenes faecalis]ATH98836.1 RNA polymerase subunit sigma-24 [Alcaligenes faecalis]AYZ91621.1 RNA polymerase subunit sigma-24 [Alcaligenes faecalis]MCX5594194.1 RNA polymerase subunit sigma-24 [Alcaligenes faecalis]QQC32558.1 RNA polymerase subunit sigma-24 [Alcaligenes faecalis]CAJ0897410.1 RNA polymerase subunit sigma-24 [Alcaligenes faecalis subsp. faecalis]
MLKSFYRNGLSFCLRMLRGTQASAHAPSEPGARMLAMIEALPRRRRDAFVLHRFEGLNYKEIATRMGTSPRVVEHYIRMAMLACRHNPAQLNRVDGAVPRPAGSYV